MKRNKHRGSTLASFLEERGIRKETDELAKQKILADKIAMSKKKLLAKKLQLELERQHVSKAALARRMGTSRTVVHALLDPLNGSLTLLTIAGAEAALGVELLEV